MSDWAGKSSVKSGASHLTKGGPGGLGVAVGVGVGVAVNVGVGCGVGGGFIC